MISDRFALTTTRALFDRLNTAPRTVPDHGDGHPPRTPRILVPRESRQQRTERLTSAIVAGLCAGKRRCELAAELHINPRTVTDMLERWQQRGGVVPESALSLRMRVLRQVESGVGSIPDICRALKAKRSGVQDALKGLAMAGRIRRVSRGVYVVPVRGAA